MFSTCIPPDALIHIFKGLFVQENIVYNYNAIIKFIVNIMYLPLYNYLLLGFCM